MVIMMMMINFFPESAFVSPISHLVLLFPVSFGLHELHRHHFHSFIIVMLKKDITSVSHTRDHS